MVGWGRLLLISAGMGCGLPDDRLRRDVSAYQAAVLGEPGACSQIGSPSLQAECLTFAAGNTAKVDLPGARAICSGISDSTWQAECGFWVCDSEVVGVLEQYGRGREAEAWEAARNVSVRALGPAGEDRAADLFIRYLADRAEGPHLRSSDCGTAPESLCAGAYTQLLTQVAATVDRAASQLVRPACAREVSVERATAMGLPGWDPEVHASVQLALRRLCAR